MPLLPQDNGKTARWYALIVGLIDFALIIYALPVRFWQSRIIQLVEKLASDTPALDLNYRGLSGYRCLIPTGSLIRWRF